MSNTPETSQSMFGVSLFSCAGIGDIGFRAGGINHILMNEIEPDRAALSALNFPNAKHIAADINSSVGEICAAAVTALKGEELFLLACTAPCQGMSSAGMGSLLNNSRAGRRPKLDPRNRLILPALDVIEELLPRWVVFENVIGMKNTVIENRSGDKQKILDIIHERLCQGLGYSGQPYEVEFADYGLPQRRKRLITVYTRSSAAIEWYSRGGSLVPRPTHSKHGNKKTKRWRTVGDALKKFPPLDAINKKLATNSSIPFHYVPVLDEKKYEWVRNTPPGQSAFDNQCINPSCMYSENTLHSAKRGTDGINRASNETPLYCKKCGSLLPRPYALENDGSKRIMRGYTSAYKRMPADLPAPTISRNLSFACSDQKLHPYENRVLSLAEAIHLQSLDRYSYSWGPLAYDKSEYKSVNKKIAPDTLIRLVLAESIPPLFTELLAKHLQNIDSGDVLEAVGVGEQSNLW